MDEATLAILGTLVEIRQELGERVYESALERARIAIAAEVLVEAERRALVAKRTLPPASGGLVIPFPARRCDGQVE